MGDQNERGASLCVIQCAGLLENERESSVSASATLGGRSPLLAFLFFWSVSGAGVSVFEQKLRVGRRWSPAKLRSGSHETADR